MKSTILRLYLTVLIFSVSGVYLCAQHKQYTLNGDKSQVSVLVDMKQTKYTAADIVYGKRGTAMLEAKLYSLGISTDTIGTWSALSGKEKIWKLDINVPQAKRFFVSFDDFYLPEDARLYVYNKSNTTDAIVYTRKDNPAGGAYSIENLTGDNVVLEYVASDNVKEAPRMLLAGVGYKYTNDSDEHDDFQTSASCMININCPEGEEWQTQKRGIVLLRMLKGNSTWLCSGTLINNTNNDKTPYLLTAGHCFENMTVEQIQNNTSFIFEYEFPTCEIKTGDQAPKYKYHKGSEVMLLNPIAGGSDGALLKLSGRIPDDWDVYFNGWDREDKPALTGAVIHHPKGDVKKISLYEKALTTGKWNGSSAVDTHWLARYSKGTTQGGSSGAPLFNQAGLVVGTLTGGNNEYCDITQPDYYGKMWYHWDQYPDDTRHMSKYLDPGNKGDIKLAGLNNNSNIDKDIVLDNNILSLIINASAGITVLDGNGDYTVASSDNNIATANIANNKITIKAVGFGPAIITVTDKRSKKADISVIVRNNIDYLVDRSKNLKVSMYKEDDSIKRVRIINLTGDTAYDKKGLDTQEHTIYVGNLSRDTYIIQVFTKNGMEEAKKITW